MVTIESLLDRMIKEASLTSDDVSLNLIEKKDTIIGNVFAKSSGLVSGTQEFALFFQKENPKVKVTLLKKDGDFINRGDVIVKMSGSARDILTYYPYALSILSHMTSLSSFVKKYLNELHDLPTKVELVDDGLKLFTCLDEKAIEVSGAKLHRDYSPNFYCYRLFQQADHRMLRSDVLKLKDSLPQPSYLEVQIDNYQDYAQIRDLNLDRICLVSMKEEDMSLILQEKIANTALCYRGNVEITKIRSLAKKGFDVIEIENGIENSKPVDLRFKVYKDAWNK